MRRHKARGLICHACKLIYFRTWKFRGRVAEAVNRRVGERRGFPRAYVERATEYFTHGLNLTPFSCPSPFAQRARIVLLSDPNRWTREREGATRVYLKNDLT